MRALVYAVLDSVPEITGRVYQQGAVEDPPERPFCIFGMSDGARSDIGSLQPVVTVSVHDDRGSYLRIDDILKQVRAALEAAVPMEDAVYRIVDVRWTGDGPDLTDNGYDTNVKASRFTLTGRK